jgi:hypothetical protein
VLSQVDAFFTAQLAAQVESGSEPLAAPEDAAEAAFPEDMMVCD